MNRSFNWNYRKVNPFMDLDLKQLQRVHKRKRRNAIYGLGQIQFYNQAYDNQRFIREDE